MSTIDMQASDSTRIAAYGYDNEAQILRIQFARGGTYDYPGTPHDIFIGLSNAESKGKYFEQYIKGRPFTKLATE